jgi:hypothetical protein
MAFDAKDISDFVETYGADFSDWLFGLLTHPFAVAEGAASKGKRLSFLVLATLIGATLGSLIPGRPPIGDRTTVAVTVVALWTFTSVMIHIVCRIFRGKGTLDATVLSMLQILAVAYVFSNLVTMVITSAEAVFPSMRDAMRSSGLDAPGTLILLLQFLMLLVYTPLVLKGVHRFAGLMVGSLVGLLAAGIVILLALPVAASGKC